MLGQTPIDPNAAGPVPTNDVEKRQEDRRTLGNALITFASTLITAILVAIYSLADKREANLLVWAILAVTITFLAASIYCGGRGIAALRSPATSKSKPKWFNTQSVCLVIGFLLAAMSLGIWVTRPSRGNQDLESLKTQVVNIQQRLTVSEANSRRTDDEIRTLQLELDRLKQQLPSGKADRHR